MTQSYFHHGDYGDALTIQCLRTSQDYVFDDVEWIGPRLEVGPPNHLISLPQMMTDRDIKVWDTVTGELRLDGTVLTEATFTVDVATITSDDGRRDNQFRGRIMSASEFPTATFALTSPADLGVEATEGASVTTAVSGDLTLRGVTLPVEVTVEARITDGRLGVLGTVPVVFTDFGIADPSIAGITVEPDGLIEFLLVLDPA